MKKKLNIKPKRESNIPERNMMQDSVRMPKAGYGGTTGMGTVPMMMFEHGGKFGSYDNRDTGYYKQGGYIWQTTPHMKHGGMPAYGQSFPEANWWGYRSSGPSQFTLPYQLDIKLPPPPEREGPIPTYRNEINSTDYDAATFKAGGRVRMKFRGENHEIYQDGDAVYVNHPDTKPGKDKSKWKKFNATKEVGAKTIGQAEHAIEEWHNANPGEYEFGGNVTTGQWAILDDDENDLPEAGKGYIVKRSNDRKGKTHVVIGPDGTKKYFGDSKLGQHPKDPERKKAFYARHKKNLDNNPYFRAFARKTWEYGGEVTEDDIPMAKNGENIAPFYKDEEDKKRYQQALTDLYYGELNRNRGSVLPYLAKDRTKIFDKEKNEQVSNTRNTCIDGVCGIMEKAGKYWNSGDVNRHYIGNQTFFDNAYGSYNPSTKQKKSPTEDVYQATGNFQVGDIVQDGSQADDRFIPSDAKVIVAIEEDSDGNKIFHTSGGSGSESLGGSSYTEDHLRDLVKKKQRVVTRPGYQLDKEKLLAERNNNASPEDLKAIEEREKLWDWERNSGNLNWAYGLRDDAPDVNTDNKYVNAFMRFANDPILVEDLARKLNVSMSDVHDELLNTFGELGQESKFGEATTPETILERVLPGFIRKDLSIGPGQIRFSTLDPDLKKKLDIKKPKDLYNPDKLIPIMTGINLLNRNYLKNKGERLGEDLADISGVDWKNIKGGIGRWTPYMYQSPRITGPKDYARRKLTDKNWIFNPTDEEVEEYYNENPRYFKRVMDPDSYASQVAGYIDRNLKRENMKGTSDPIELMEPVITPSSTKQPYTEKAPLPGQSVPSMEFFGKGGMIKRKDGSYSRRGLWDNIRANKGSGKKPTKEMLAQERKIKMKENKAGMGMRLDLNPLPVMPARSAGNGASLIDLHLPKYPDRRTQNLYATPYMFGLSPAKDVNVYGAGASFGVNFLDRGRNTFGATGNVNNTAVSYPGGFEISSDPYRSLGLRYVHRFQKGGMLPKAGDGKNTGYSWSTNTAQAPKQALSTPKDTNISKTRNSALTAIDIKPGATSEEAPFYGDYQDEMFELKESNTPYIDKLDSMEWDYRFDDWKASKLFKPKFQKTVNLTQGRFNTAKVSESVLDEVVASAIRNRKPVGDLLTLMGRESTFGQQKGKEHRGGSKKELISGWNLAEKYEPYTALRFLADRGVDGIKKINDPLGLYFYPDDENNGTEKIEEYLSKNPKVFEAYQKKLSTTPNSNGKDYFDLAYEFIDEKGIKGYNPGDPDYVNKYQKDYQLLQQDPELQKYLKSRNIPFDKPQKSQVILPSQPRQIMPELKRGGRISKAQTGTAVEGYAPDGTPIYRGGSLREVEVVAQKPKSFRDFTDRYINDLSDRYSHDLAGTLFLAAPDAILGFPQAAATYALSSNKSLVPSEALGIENPYGAFAANAVLDPSNLVGAGLADDAFKFSNRAKNLFRKGFKKPVEVPAQLRGSDNVGNYQNILNKGLDIHDVRLKYHNNMVLDFDEVDMLNKFGKGTKKNYERVLTNDIAGKMHVDDAKPIINENTPKSKIVDMMMGTEQSKVAIPDKNVKPFEINEDINPTAFKQEQNIIKPPKFEIPSFYSDPYQRTSTSRAADKWLEDWFYNPETKQKFLDYGGTEGEWQEVLNSLENPIKSNYTWGKNQPGGVYIKPFDQASIPLNATVDIGVHEGIHKAKLLLDNKNPILHRLWNDFTDAVRLTPSEAYPEIFRFRQKLGLKPGQTIDLKTMENNLHLISDGYSLPYKIKDKNKLLEIINKAPAVIPPAAIGAGAMQEQKLGGKIKLKRAQTGTKTGYSWSTNTSQAPTQQVIGSAENTQFSPSKSRSFNPKFDLPKASLITSQTGEQGLGKDIGEDIITAALLPGRLPIAFGNRGLTFVAEALNPLGGFRRVKPKFALQNADPIITNQTKGFNVEYDGLLDFQKKADFEPYRFDNKNWYDESDFVDPTDYLKNKPTIINPEDRAISELTTSASFGERPLLTQKDLWTPEEFKQFNAYGIKPKSTDFVEIPKKDLRFKTRMPEPMYNEGLPAEVRNLKQLENESNWVNKVNDRDFVTEMRRTNGYDLDLEDIKKLSDEKLAIIAKNIKETMLEKAIQSKNKFLKNPKYTGLKAYQEITPNKFGGKISLKNQSQGWQILD